MLIYIILYLAVSVDESIALTLSPCGSTCIDLEWTTLQGSNGNILRYEVSGFDYVIWELYH